MVFPLRLVFALASVPAPEGARVAVLPLATEGSIDPGVAARVHAQVIRGLARGGAEVVDADAVRTLAPTGCADAACIVAVGTASAADFVVRPRLAHRDRDFTIDLALFDGETGVELARAHDECDICGLEEVETAAADQAALLHGKLASLQAAPTTVRIASEPSGARVWIDGEPVGTTPMVRQVVPGSHTLRVEQRGFAAEHRSIEVTEGVEQALQLALVGLPAEQRRPRGALVTGGAAMIGAGAAVATGGAVLLALDGRQYQRRCSGDDVDAAGTCRLSYDTLAGGAAALSVGLAAAAVGTAMLIVGKRRGRRVAVAGGWRGVVVRGRF